MNQYLFLFFFASISLFSSCQSSPSGPPVLTKQHYTFAGSNRCDTTTNAGVDVSVTYVLLADESKDGSQKINDSLRHLAVNSIAGWLDSATVAGNPEARTDLAKAAALFAADYEAVEKDMGRLSGCWEVKTTADTVYVGPKALTVKYETFAYTGGAHPNSNLSFYTFDRQMGRMLTLSDMVSDTTALTVVVEKAFRKQQHIQGARNLEEQGYFLRDGRFFLPNNIGMSREGMIFYYNPYEIAAYVLGPIQLIIPYEQLNGIVRNDWL